MLQHLSTATAVLSGLSIIGALLKRSPGFEPLRVPMLVLGFGMLASSTSDLARLAEPWSSMHPWVGIALLVSGSALMLRAALAVTRAELEERDDPTRISHGRTPLGEALQGTVKGPRHEGPLVVSGTEPSLLPRAASGCLGAMALAGR